MQVEFHESLSSSDPWQQEAISLHGLIVAIEGSDANALLSGIGPVEMDVTAIDMD